MIQVSEPFPEDLLPRLFAWLKHLIKAPLLDDYAPKDVASFVRLMRSGGYRSWAVTVAGEVGGFVSYQPRNDIGGTCWFVFKPECHRHADVAVAEVLRQLFVESEVQRVQFLLMRRGRAFQDSPSVTGVLKRLGGRCEGVMVGSTQRDGHLMDESVWAITRPSFFARGEKANACISDSGGAGDRERGGQCASQPQEGADGAVHQQPEAIVQHV